MLLNTTVLLDVGLQKNWQQIKQKSTYITTNKIVAVKNPLSSDKFATYVVSIKITDYLKM
jgi:hypothetical protein